MCGLGACTCHVVHVQVRGKLSETASPLPAISKDLIQVFRNAGQASLPTQLSRQPASLSLNGCLGSNSDPHAFTPPPLVLSSLGKLTFQVSSMM